MSVPYTSDELRHWIETRGFEIGEHTYGTPKILSWAPEDGRLFIGRYCSIAGDVRIFLGGNHRLDWVTTYPFTALPAAWPEAAGIPGHPASRGDVRIGNDVWLGQGCTILSGVIVGDGAVIAAGALVARDVPPYAVAAGNPARVVRRRFADTVVEALLRVRWWDWPESEVRAAVPLLCAPDLAAFLARYDPKHQLPKASSYL